MSEDILKILHLFKKALGAIHLVSENALVNDAADAVQVIQAITKTVLGHENKVVTPEQIEANMQALLKTLEKNDKDANALLVAKFFGLTHTMELGERDIDPDKQG